jgi:O-antigen ligase
MRAPDASAGARPWAASALVVTVALLLAAAVFFGGGSGNGSLATLGSLAVAAAAAAVVAAAFGALALPRLDGAARAFVAAGVLLTALAGASVVWSIAGDRSWAGLGKGLVYLAFVGLGLALSASAPRPCRVAAVTVAGVLAAALAWALVGRAVPGLFPDGGRIARLREPVDYWNALALLAGAAVPLGLWAMTAVTRRGATRAAGALLTYGAVLALLLTQSRAGLLALAVAVIGWLALSRARLEGGLLGLAAGVPGVLAAGWAFTRPALVEDGALRADRVDDGVLFAIVAGVGAVVAVGLALWTPAERLVAHDSRRVVRALVASAAALVACALAALVVSVGNPVAWAGDQVSGGECANDPGRLAELCANNRLEWWRDALEVARAHPVGGTGSLTYEIARKRVRADGTPVRQPHSVPLQLLSDLGAAGLLLGLLAVGAGAVGVTRSLRRLDGAEREAGVALAMVPVVFLVHGLVDYSLDFVAVVAPTLVATAVLLGAARPAVIVRSRLIWAAAAVAAATAGVVVLVSPALAEREVDRSTRLLDEKRLSAAADAARRARSLDPLALDPVYAAAAAADRLGDSALARALYTKATRMQPENPEPWITLGLYELAARQDLCRAYAALNAAYTLDPNGRQWIPGGPLDQARDAVNRGACERPPES